MICAYAANTTDFSGNGLGPLDPIECTVSETLNGMWELTLTHARDERGKCDRLQMGNIIKAPVPAGFTPQLSISDPEESREIWAVNISERVALRAGPSQSDRLLHAYQTGTEVVVLDKPAGNYWEVVTPDGRHGWMWHNFLEYVRTESGATAQEDIREARALREQPFRIYRIEPGIDMVTVYARHVFYDLADNLLGTCAPDNATGAEAARAILAACRGEHEFTMYSDLTNTGSGEYTDRTPTDAIFGDGGLCDTWGAEIARDWWDVYAVERVGRDTDVVIRQGKNLMKLRGDIDMSNAATRIVPVGTDSDGKALYLPGDTPWIDSEDIDQYPIVKWRLLTVKEAKVGNGMTRDQAIAAMEAAAQAALDGGCDAMACTLDVDFVNPGDTEEYRNLQLLYDVSMGDSVRVIAPLAGIDMRMRVTDYTYDCLARRYKDMSLGTVADTMATVGISARQIANASLSGAKLIRGSVGVEQLRDLSVTSAKIALASIGYAHIKAATIEQLAANSITAITARIQELIAGHITTDDLYAALATIAVAEITTANIQSANIDWAQITNLTAKIAEIGRAQITTANIAAANISWADIQTLNAAVASIADARISSASITTAQIADLQAQIAGVITLAAQDGRFDFAKVSDLVASAMILEEGIAGTVYIKNLVATHANFVGAIIGELVLKSTDDKYYEVEVQSDGTIRTSEVTVSAAEIAAGETTDGRGIVATTANVASLNAGNIKADSAIIGSIFTSALTADKISASEAFLASATIPEIRTTAIQAIGDSLDLSANSSIRLLVNSIAVGGTNLFTGTQDFSGTDWVKKDHGWSYSSDTYNGCKIASKAIAWNCMTQKVWVDAGSEYTYSAWVKCSTAQTMQWLFYRSETTDHCTVEGGNTGTIANVGTDWQRISFTKKVATSGWAEPGIDVQNNGVTWYVCGLKFERGNKATDWCPHPDDIYSYTNAQIVLLNNAISAKAAQTTVDGLTTRMETAEGKITPAAIVNTVRSSTQYQSDLGGKADAAALANYSTTSQTAQEISAAVTAVKVGGVNLFTGTRRFADDGQWTRLASWTITNTEFNGCLVAQKSVYWNCMSQKVTVEAGAEYTYSAWVKCSSTQTLQWLFYRDGTSGHCTVDGSNTGFIYNVGTEWQRVSFTVKIATSGIAEPGIDVQNNGVTWYICGIKLERGNKATDWCEAEGEFFAGSTARMTKDGFFFAGDTWEVDLPGDENFHLDSAGGSMKNFSADTVKAKNLAEVYTGPASVTIGSGGTYKSLREFANAVNNRVVTKEITATLLDSNYYENVEFAGITGGGRIIIVGAKNIVGQTRLVNNPIYMRFDNVTFIGYIYMLNVGFIRFNECTFNGNGNGTGSSVQQAFYMDHGCNAFANSCGFYNAASLIVIDSGSMFESLNAKGGNCVNFILATRCSVFMQGTRPGGNRATTTVLSPNDMTSLTIDYGSSTPVVNPTTTTTISCKASRTAYDAGSPKWYNAVGDVPQARLRQGFLNMGSSGNNEQYGCMWFDTSALSGKTIKSALLTLTRIAGYGRSSEVSVRLYTTPLTSASGNPLTNAVDQGVLGTIGNGETKQFTIPTAAISASANKGFMLRVDDGALISGRGYSDNYAHFYGYGESSAPALTVTYQ